MRHIPGGPQTYITVEETGPDGKVRISKKLKSMLAQDLTPYNEIVKRKKQRAAEDQKAETQRAAKRTKRALEKENIPPPTTSATSKDSTTRVLSQTQQAAPLNPTLFTQPPSQILSSSPAIFVPSTQTNRHNIVRLE